jgi:hypothetical protein
MTILERLPIAEEGWRVPTPDGAEDVFPYQIVVRVSITPDDIPVCPPDAPAIPAILDTGHNHNFAIRREHWDRWIRWTPRRIGQINVGGSIVPLFAARLWIHPNREGTVEPSGQGARALRVDRGIAIYPTSLRNPARLLILGVRALIRNKLRLTIDGAVPDLTLEAPSA